MKSHMHSKTSHKHSKKISSISLAIKKNNHSSSPAQKKGQLEVMGLAIIVILLVLGVLFAVTTLVNKTPYAVKQVYTDAQLTSNLGIALLQASTPNCRQATLQDLLSDCAEYSAFGGSITCDDGRKSCQYFNESLSLILNETFKVWIKPYSITAYQTPSIPLFHETHLGCTDRSPGRAEFFTLPTSTFSTVTLKIFICSQYVETP